MDGLSQIDGLRKAFAELGEHLFYTLNSNTQRDFLEVVKQRLENYDFCDYKCKYTGSRLLCDFCEAFDEDTLEETVKKLNENKIPSDLKIVF